MSTVQPSTSPRPEIVVDPRARSVGDIDGGRVGLPGPFGRERVLFALPLDPGPVQLAPAELIVDPISDLVGNGGVVGLAPPLWVSRMQTARWTEDTRRLAG